jgi:hypothetical protein
MVDEKSGPNQDQPGSDGVGNTPYIARAFNIQLEKARHEIEELGKAVDYMLSQPTRGAARRFKHAWNTKDSTTISKEGRIALSHCSKQLHPRNPT